MRPGWPSHSVSRPSAWFAWPRPGSSGARGVRKCGCASSGIGAVNGWAGRMVWMVSTVSTVSMGDFEYNVGGMRENLWQKVSNGSWIDH